MKAKIKFFTTALLIFSFFFFSGCTKEKEVKYGLNLEVWGLFDDSRDFSEAISAYVEMNPYVGRINYRKLTVEDYEDELLNAMAEGKGPDIFMIHNDWLPKYKTKIESAPTAVISEQLFKSNFVDVVSRDFLSENKVYAVPLSVDSLSLYYNKDIFNAYGIVSPPKTWEEFEEIVQKVTKIDDVGDITRSGAAMGTAYNINRSTDIVDLLMFQKGIELPTQARDKLNLNSGFQKEGQMINPAEEALNFYTQFAKPSSDNYTWNSKMHYSLDSFYEGKLAMMINYSWHWDTIMSKNSKLNFSAAPIPQVEESNPVNYANYWAYTVSKNKAIPDGSKYNNEIRIHEAWQFLKFLTTRNNGSIALTNAVTKNTKVFPVGIDPAKQYVEKTRKPAARRDLIDEQKKDARLSPFAYGNLIAKSWYKEDPSASEAIWGEVINSINKGNITIEEGLRLATTRIEQLSRN